MKVKSLLKVAVGAAGLFTGYCVAEGYQRLKNNKMVMPMTLENLAKATGSVMKEFAEEFSPVETADFLIWREKQLHKIRKALKPIDDLGVAYDYSEPLIYQDLDRDIWESYHWCPSKKYCDRRKQTGSCEGCVYHEIYYCPRDEEPDNFVKDTVIAIVDLFEEMLDAKDIDIVCDDEEEEFDRSQNEDSARIYGTEYGDLCDDVECLVLKLIDHRYLDFDGKCCGKEDGKCKCDGKCKESPKETNPQVPKCHWKDKDGVTHILPECPGEADCYRRQEQGCEGCQFAFFVTRTGADGMKETCTTCPGRISCDRRKEHGCARCPLMRTVHPDLEGYCENCFIEDGYHDCYQCPKIPDAHIDAESLK